MRDIAILQRVLDVLSEEPLSVHQLCCRAKLDARTVDKYLQLIELAQSGKKIKFERKGLRFLVRLEP